MFTYFEFDGTQTVNGASPEKIRKAFGLKDGQRLFFIEKDGNVAYHSFGDENVVKAMIETLEHPEESALHSMELEDAKQFKIAQSKEQLAEFLKTHPLRSAAHGGQEKTYSVTAEKQAQLTSVLLMATAAAQSGANYEITWNAAGEPCETWTLEELAKLAYEINDYIKPLVAEQQYLEIAVNACETVEDVSMVKIDYENCIYAV